MCNTVNFSMLTYSFGRNIIRPSKERSRPLMFIRRNDNMMMGMMRMMMYMCMMMHARQCPLAS